MPVWQGRAAMPTPAEIGTPSLVDDWLSGLSSPVTRASYGRAFDAWLAWRGVSEAVGVCDLGSWFYATNDWVRTRRDRLAPYGQDTLAAGMSRKLADQRVSALTSLANKVVATISSESRQSPGATYHAETPGTWAIRYREGRAAQLLAWAVGHGLNAAGPSRRRRVGDSARRSPRTAVEATRDPRDHLILTLMVELRMPPKEIVALPYPLQDGAAAILSQAPEEVGAWLRERGTSAGPLILNRDRAARDSGSQPGAFRGSWPRPVRGWECLACLRRRCSGTSPTEA